MKNLPIFIVVLLVTASCSTSAAQVQEDVMIYLPLVRRAPGDHLFNVTFESGNLNEFDSTFGRGLDAIAPGLVATIYCQAVEITDTGARYGQVSTEDEKNRIRLFFALDTNGIIIDSGDRFAIALVQDGNWDNAFRVELGYDDTSGYRVRPGIKTDGHAWSNGPWVNISDNEHTIEVDWKRSSGSNENDGFIKMWVDAYDSASFETADSSVTGMDNDTKTASVFRFGAPTGLDSGTSGTILLDHMVADDTPSAIGHPGVLAFPGAEGAGRYTVGGRGGTVYHVTNLKNGGPGSLRAALEATGRRTVVFKVAGTIELNSPLSVLNPYVSVLGQTAPGDGICVRGEPIRIRTHDVIIRYIRMRPGDEGSTDPEDADALDIGNNPSGPTDTDGMGFNVIVDHCSFSWALDENVSLWNAQPEVNFMRNVTLQWCIISEGLNADDSSMGLLAGAVDHTRSIKNLSIHHCLLAHNGRRSPRLAAASPVEVVNNVMHDCPGYTVLIDHVATHVNFIGNTISDHNNVYTLLVEPRLGPESPVEDYQDHQIHVDDNNGNFYNSDDWEIVGKGWEANQWADGAYREAWEVNTPIHIANSKLQAVERSTAYNIVLDSSGCLPRDGTDERVVQNVTDDDTGLIDSQNQVGGWPYLSPGLAPTDSDNDGMSDNWEDAHGLDKNVADDDRYTLSPIYTNLEVYSHELAASLEGG
ncbi:MAG: hypothetical protein SWK90_09560 [Chloroflexota bacterium]|nr:hypothetical protein [Chloroflexota bacterium]